MSNVIDLIVFSSGIKLEFGKAIAKEIESIAEAEGMNISAITWKDEFFFGPEGAQNRYALNECIRKLHSFDGAILILGPNKRSPFRIFGGREPVSPNVLIEIGAAMARFGRKRVFLLEPKSKSVDVPTYFRENNALFFEYDDNAGAEQAIASAARKIVDHLKALGSTAFFSDLPSFGLAHGYFNALIKPSILNVREGAEVTVGDQSKVFTDAQCVIAYTKGRIVQRDEANQAMDAAGFVSGRIDPKDRGRTISFRTVPDALERDVLPLFDMPINMVPSMHAIEKVEDLWADPTAPDTANIEYRESLAARELRNYQRYLDVLREDYNAKGGSKIGESAIQWIGLENLSDLTLERISSALDG